MSNQPGATGGMAPQSISTGTEVFDASGQTVGVVKEYNPQANYLVVQAGWFFPQDAYFPLDAVGDTGASGIYLKDNRDALLQQNWQSPPTGASTSSGVGTATAGTAMSGAASNAQTTTTTGGTMNDSRNQMTSDTMMSNADMATTTTGSTIGSAGSVQVPEGTPVFDMNGDKVGTVSEHGIQDGSLVIHHGLFRRDVYVPLNAIQRSDVDGVYLTLTKDEILNEDQYVMQQDTTTVDQGAYTTTTGQMQTPITRADVTTDTTTTTTDTQDVRVPVMEEELVAGKRQDEIGRVHLHKDVVEEQQTITEPVTREEVTVERVPVTAEATTTDADAFTEKDIDVPVMGEELVAGKRAVVNEEVRLRKDAVTRNEQVSGTVRKERVTVEGADETGAEDVTSDVIQSNTTQWSDRDTTQ